MELVTKHHTDLRNPLQTSPKFYALVETQGSNNEHDEEKLTCFVNELIDDNIVSDGVVASTGSQSDKFWSIREFIPEACSKEGCTFKYDISIPIPNLYEIVPVMRNRLMNYKVNVVGYGHAGDGNIHLNIIADSFDPRIRDQIEPFVYEFTSEKN